MFMPTERTITFKAAIIEALSAEMEADESVVILGEDVGVAGGVFKQTEGLFERFGASRVIDTPISESAIVGMAVGAAMTGLRPIVEIMFGDFVTLAMDSIVNQAAKIRYLSASGFHVPMVLRTAIGVGGNLGAQHSQGFHAWLAHVPGLKVVMPATPQDAKSMMAAAIRDNDPVIFVEDRHLYNQHGTVEEGPLLDQIGSARVVRSGRDVSLIAIGRSVRLAQATAEQLIQCGVDAEVIDLRSLTPLDSETLLQSVRKTSRAVVIDLAPRAFGITGEIAARIAEEAFDYLDAPVLRIGAPMVPVPFSTSLEPLVTPKAEDIANRVLTEMGHTK
jgi:acetoin:2,6-dichlorophenolindophenol oxidoreductase subunit beta